MLKSSRSSLLGILAVIALALVLFPGQDAVAESATDLPLWFDVSTGTPPNLKLNTDLTTQLQNEEQVAVDPTNPDNLVAVWRDFRLGYRQVGWSYSHDGGTTWTEGGLVPATPYNRDSDPGITVGSDGTFYAVMLSFDQFSSANGLFVPVSLDSGLNWLGPFVGIDTPSGTFEDKELMTCDVTGGPSDGNLYIAWTRFGDSTGIFCVSSVNGVSFGLPTPVSDVGSVQWPVPIVGSDGRLVIAWWSAARGAIMYDISFDEGGTFGTDCVLADLSTGSQSINGGITTFPFPALASDVTGGPYNGNLYCAFTDDGADGFLDLYFTISTDGGDSWSPRQRINDDPLGNNTDQFHPWTFVNPDGVITVAFYDRRLDPNNLDFDMFVTHSFDGGQTWTPNQRVSNVSSSPFDAVASGRFSPEDYILDPGLPISIQSPQAGLIGEYIGLATSRMRATVVFTDTRNGNQDVYAANMPLRLFPPKLTGPADGVLSTDAAVTFTWEDWSIYDSALTYVLEYSSDPAFLAGVTRVPGLIAQSYTATVPDGEFYWRVRSFDHFGDSSGTEVRVLTVDATAPAVPALISPAPGDTISDPTPLFVWSAVTAFVAGAQTPVDYDLLVSITPDSPSVVFEYTGIVTTQFEIPDSDSLGYDMFWEWAVRANDGAGHTSGYSPFQAFFIKQPYLLGDLNDDGFIDAVDMALLIDVVFFGVAVPVPPAERAELDCNGPPDAVDLALMIDHVFFGAPAPACP